MLSAGTGGGRGLLGWRWSAAVVMEWLGVSLCTVMVTAELRELGCCCGEEERPEKAKRGRGTARAGAGGVKAAFRCVVACAIRALVTRGHRRRHAARGSCRWSATDNVDQFVSVNHTEPDDACSR